MLNGQVIFVYPGVEGNPGLITSAEFKAAIAFKPKGLLVVAAVRMPSGGALRFYLVSVRPTPSFSSMNVIKSQALIQRNGKQLRLRMNPRLMKMGRISAWG